jgi:hypothetical protein
VNSNGSFIFISSAGGNNAAGGGITRACLGEEEMKNAAQLVYFQR